MKSDDHLDWIIEYTAAYMGVSRSELLSKRRRPNGDKITRARQVAMVAASRYGYTLKAIGAAMGRSTKAIYEQVALTEDRLTAAKNNRV